MPYFQAFQLFWLRLPYLWIQSLLWWISIVSYFDIQVNPCWNRTLTYHFPTSISLNHDWTLGGPRYIHLTKETNAVFSSFFSLLATVAISMNPITKWWISIITYFDIQINPYWNRTLTYHFSTSVGVNHDWTLGGACYIHLTTRTNAVFSSFSACFGYGDLLYELNHFCDESSAFLFRHFYMPQLKSNS